MSEEVVKDIFLYKITTKVLINACDDTIAHLKSKLSKPFLWHDMLRSDLKNVLKVGMTENVRELREEAVEKNIYYYIFFWKTIYWSI